MERARGRGEAEGDGLSPARVGADPRPKASQDRGQTGKFEEEVTLVRKDGSKFLAKLTVRPLKSGKEITGFMGLTRPIRNL
jgi:hypothetical protein